MLKQPLKTVPQWFSTVPSAKVILSNSLQDCLMWPLLTTQLHLLSTSALPHYAPTTLAFLEFTESTSDFAASGLCAHCFVCLEYSSPHFLSVWFFKLLVWANILLSLTNTSRLPSPDILYHSAQLLKQRMLELGESWDLLAHWRSKTVLLHIKYYC